MRVLVACEYSGRVREAFRKQGHTAWSADLLPADDGSMYHYEGDVRDILDKRWDLMVAHPPCTYLSNSGVRWLHTDPDRWDLMKDGADFFKELLDADIPKKAIENPIPHKYAVERIGRKYDQLIQPYQFGHKETKATCLWLQGLPKLEPTTDLKEETMALPAKERARIHHLPPSADRWKIRSTTYQGFADAMGEQWG